VDLPLVSRPFKRGLRARKDKKEGRRSPGGLLAFDTASRDYIAFVVFVVVVVFVDDMLDEPFMSLPAGGMAFMSPAGGMVLSMTTVSLVVLVVVVLLLAPPPQAAARRAAPAIIAPVVALERMLIKRSP
jgi:hypothetical protein